MCVPTIVIHHIIMWSINLMLKVIEIHKYSKLKWETFWAFWWRSAMIQKISTSMKGEQTLIPCESSSVKYLLFNNNYECFGNSINKRKALISMLLQKAKEKKSTSKTGVFCYLLWRGDKVLVSIWSIIYGGAGEGRHLRGIRRHRLAHPQPQGNTAGNIRENFIHRSSGTLCSWSRFSDVKIPHSGHCPFSVDLDLLCLRSLLYQGIYTCYFRGHFFKSNSSM